jgi:hypothetical protein
MKKMSCLHRNRSSGTLGIEISSWIFSLFNNCGTYRRICYVAVMLDEVALFSQAKQSLDRALRLQEVEARTISRQSAHEGGKVVSPTHRPPLPPPPPPGNIPGTHFCQRLSRPQGHSATGRIMSTKNPMTSWGIVPATFRAFVSNM